MRRAQKELAKNCVRQMEQAHMGLRKALEQHELQNALHIIADCQTKAIELGTMIEETEGNGFVTVSMLEEYCEKAYRSYQSIESGEDIGANKIYKILRQQLIKISNSIANDIKTRMEMVFLPYKASMWDSLESIWKAADADPDCDAYVVPIPYFDKNTDGTFKEMHCEGNLMPPYVPTVNWEKYDFAERMPDAIFIHNPYDNNNIVTSVHPFFYSENLKKFTQMLVYVPYYSTTGGMSEGQKSCPAYYNADYIVIQSEKYRKFFDSAIPDKKFLPFGSPKFDAVIKKCQNPPEVPAEWKEKMYDSSGNKKKVYFYNTSIGGMLDNTGNFLKKMCYVFDSFKGRDDACLLWRPHPLMEATFDSMKPRYKPAYEALKRKYTEGGWGIYDTTPSIEDTIANSDVYIGDGGTSVTSLFGVAGKPVFILDNSINTLPSGDDWRGMMFQTQFQTEDGLYHDRYYVSYNNKLYYSPDDDMNYKYFCDLSEYSGGGYYSRAFDYKDRIYVFPNNAQHILAVTRDKKVRRIELKNEVEQAGAFAGFWICGDYAFLLPNRYPALVRFDMGNERVTYLDGVGAFNIAVTDNNERIPAMRFIWRGRMHFLNPGGTQLLSIDIGSLKTSVRPVDINRLIISAGLREPDGEELWLIPYEGTTVTRWNAVTGEKKEYDLAVDGIEAVNRRYKIRDSRYVFGSMAFMDDEIIFAPNWGNKFVTLNPDTGSVQEWISPFDTSAQDVSQYMANWGIGYFWRDVLDLDRYRFVYSPKRRIYDIDLHTKEIREVPQSFDRDDVYDHADGYGRQSQWLKYGCCESLFNSIRDELDGEIHGGAFDREEQIREYAEINASPDGDSGEKIYRYVSGNLK